MKKRRDKKGKTATKADKAFDILMIHKDGSVSPVGSEDVEVKAHGIAWGRKARTGHDHKVVDTKTGREVYSTVGKDDFRKGRGLSEVDALLRKQWLDGIEKDLLAMREKTGHYGPPTPEEV